LISVIFNQIKKCESRPSNVVFLDCLVHNIYHLLHEKSTRLKYR